MILAKEGWEVRALGRDSIALNVSLSPTPHGTRAIRAQIVDRGYGALVYSLSAGTPSDRPLVLSLLSAVGFQFQTIERQEQAHGT